MKTYLMAIVTATFLSGTALAAHCHGNGDTELKDVRTIIEDKKADKGGNGNALMNDLVIDKDQESSSSKESNSNAETNDTGTEEEAPTTDNTDTTTSVTEQDADKS